MPAGEVEFSEFEAEDGEDDGARMEVKPCGRADVRRENFTLPVVRERWSSWRPTV